MNNQNIYITNFWYSVNYGANLTAYALYKIVSEWSKNTYLNDNIRIRERLLYNKFYVHKFAEQYFKIKKYAYEKDAVLITGSNQVFNPECEKKYHTDNILNFGAFNNKKIAFSASFGLSKQDFLKENTDEIIENMKNSLKTFDFISVREKSGLEICSEIFGVNAEWVIDPVFILEKQKWEELIDKSSVNAEGRIASYILCPGKEHIKAYNYLAEKYNAQVLKLDNFKYQPQDWLKTIKDCRFLITNSFHGVCFAVIFNKPFICLSNEMKREERFNSLFEILNIQNQSIDLHEIYEKDCIFNINYEAVNKKIDEERKKGLDFLKKALTSEIINTKEKTEAKIKVLDNRLAETAVQNNPVYHIKTFIWENWLVIYHYYLPEPVKNIIRFFRKR